ncbi:MAG: hypothetical protein UR63_C0036G0002 [Candidatus Roizmanbacteria bacterium GW2011_GWC2_35_12]|nr:MAG: hypothetical protein UR63_C0036G0002 [Candidatus Roizmanbacteria bacterium GW2011_GWC2_35_12]
MTEAPIPPAVLKSNKSGSPISNLDMPLPRRSAGGESFLSEQAGGVKLGKLGNDENFSPLPSRINAPHESELPDLSHAEQAAFINALKTEGIPTMVKEKPIINPQSSGNIRPPQETSIGKAAASETATGVRESINIIINKIKEFAKKIWYYGTGSPFWEKLFGSTPPPKPA